MRLMNFFSSFYRQNLVGGLTAGLVASSLTLTLPGCGGGNEPGDIVAGTSSTGVMLKATVVAGNLEPSWGFTFMPDGKMLVTEKAGQMVLISADGRTKTVVTGLPPVFTGGQGGLLDVQLDPDYPAAPWIYWSYAEPGTGSETGLAGTAVARGQLVNNAITNVQVLFRQVPKVDGANHFGSRLAFANDKTLFVTLGERMKDSTTAPTTEFAQNLGVHLGKIIRINRDGSLPSGNPFLNTSGVRPEIWSYGHRNVQGAAIHPVTGELWASEHGPQGGDEVNRVQAGHNYGWPLRSYGCPYGSTPGDACRIGGGTHAPDFDEPLTYWVPTSTAPSGMAFNTGSRYPGWEGNLFVGALAGQTIWRLTLDGNKVVSRESLFANTLGRIRHVRQGPDGYLYALTDGANGRIVRIERAPG